MEKKANFPFRYFVVTFIWSWLIEMPLVLAGFGIIPMEKDLIILLTYPVMTIAAFGPAMGAFYSLRTLNGKGSIREYLKGLFDFRFGWKAWILPLIILGGCACIAWIVPELWGEPRLKMILPSLWAFPPYLILMIFFGGGQEELGWRGYILDPLEDRLGPWFGNILLGMIWAVWHLPIFFIPGNSLTFMNYAAFTMQTIGYCWFFSWVRKTSGNRIMAGPVVHGFANAVFPLFPTVVMIKGAPQPRFWIWTSLLFVTGIMTMFIHTRKARRIEMAASDMNDAFHG